MKVPFLRKQRISDVAANVVSDYEAMIGKTVAPPIPVENIIEQSLGLSLGFIDFEEKYGMPDIYGATYVKKKFIAISTTLLDEHSEGRYCFTCAHEIGHWVLHRHLVDAAARRSKEEGAVFCREKDAKAPIEWQADYFAGCLLMPENEIEAAFHQIFGCDVLNLYIAQRVFPPTPFHFDICVDNWQLIADAVRRAGGFSNISKQAMMIRLQDLGLVVNHTDQPINWRCLKLKN
jgi:Zn-dependent peptidase ImmA (M78 family)